MTEMISLEEARDLVLSHVDLLPAERVSLLDAAGRVAAEELKSDIDIAPFSHSAMDGYALRSADVAKADTRCPIVLEVVAEVAAGDVYAGSVGAGQCVRIMTGAPVPADTDTVVKYEDIVPVSGEGNPGGQVMFVKPAPQGSHIRAAGEEARAGEIIVHPGEYIKSAGIGVLAGCGITEVSVYRRPRVAVISIGSELVEPGEVLQTGKIRNSNCFAIAACVRAAGGIPEMLPIVKDNMDALCTVIVDAAKDFDFVVTTGGASDGDFDFIKPAVSRIGDLLMTKVNMRPGKAQTFGLVEGRPVFGLPGNPAAAYCGFELIIRAALRKMQGFSSLERVCVKARLLQDVKKKDARRIYLRSTLAKDASGGYVVTPAKNQSSGLFGVIQRSNCLAVMPEGLTSRNAGDMLECIVLDVDEGTIL